MRADHRWTRGPRNPTGNERIGRCARRQVRLAARAVVVVDANDDGAVMIAATDHRSIPIKVQVPPRPCFLYLCLDLREGKTKGCPQNNGTLFLILWIAGPSNAFKLMPGLN